MKSVIESLCIGGESGVTTMSVEISVHDVGF